ncbi:uncharacterized protein EAF01_011881 [Botrytis porri]|uniref:Uncharacterized protein n=1 Tax=Botrytis porri TaxID=87229 RepID=A0A4Z1KGD1_9HELO|nr:uncharacterized protein EAF01_011881 [Botrytis porri]KAF7881370.1 hypothetical protein EAF01_011881 [Botrytis porri]TGO82594.1 hypothetical protein BPOR_0797g00050 [Botrytis porri]
MTRHHRHDGHSGHCHDNDNDSTRAEEQRRDQEIPEKLSKELKQRRSRKERLKMAREMVEEKKGTPYWFEIDESEKLLRHWKIAEEDYRERRDSDEGDMARELKIISQHYFDSERRGFAVAKLERKWNAFKAENDAKKKERDQALEEAWLSEFSRWMEELSVADSYDTRYAGPDEDGVTWTRQQLVDINDEISDDHLTKCLPSLQKPDSRGTHCKDCEDEDEVGPFWDEVHRLGL